MKITAGFIKRDDSYIILLVSDTNKSLYGKFFNTNHTKIYTLPYMYIETDKSNMSANLTMWFNDVTEYRLDIINEIEMYPIDEILIENPLIVDRLRMTGLYNIPSQDNILHEDLNGFKDMMRSILKNTPILFTLRNKFITTNI